MFRIPTIALLALAAMGIQESRATDAQAELKDRLAQYEAAKKAGDAIKQCGLAGSVALSYGKLLDKANHEKWMAQEKIDCDKAMSI